MDFAYESLSCLSFPNVLLRSIRFPSYSNWNQDVMHLIKRIIMIIKWYSNEILPIGHLIFINHTWESIKNRLLRFYKFFFYFIRLSFESKDIDIDQFFSFSFNFTLSARTAKSIIWQIFISLFTRIICSLLTWI